jgi:hypothetical protein
MGPALIKLSDLAITAFQGIVFEESGFAHGIGQSISEITFARCSMVYVSKGIKQSMQSIDRQNIAMQPTVTAAPGSNIFGVWTIPKPKAAFSAVSFTGR